MKNKKRIIAYYSGYTFPARGRSYMTVSIEVGDFQFIDIFRKHVRNITRKNDLKCARVILKHYDKNMIRFAEGLVDWPGHSLCRLTVKDLYDFRVLHSQQNLFQELRG